MPDRFADEPATGFSYLHWVWDNMRARPLRSALSIVAIAIQIVLVLLIAGLTSGVVYEWGKRVEGVGADILVQPPNSSIFFAFSSAVMQESLAERVEHVQVVDVVAPALIVMDTRNFVLFSAFASARFNA